MEAGLGFSELVRWLGAGNASACPSCQSLLHSGVQVHARSDPSRRPISAFGRWRGIEDVGMSGGLGGSPRGGTCTDAVLDSIVEHGVAVQWRAG